MEEEEVGEAEEADFLVAFSQDGTKDSINMHVEHRLFSQSIHSAQYFFVGPFLLILIMNEKTIEQL